MQYQTYEIKPCPTCIAEGRATREPTEFEQLMSVLRSIDARLENIEKAAQADQKARRRVTRR